MELGAVDAEAFDGIEHDTVEEAGAIGAEEPGQCPSHAVVVEQSHLGGVQAQQRRVERRSPLTEGVDGFAVQHQVAHDDPECLGWGQA